MRTQPAGAASPETRRAYDDAELAHLQLLASAAPDAEVRAAARKVQAAWAVLSRFRRLVPRPRTEDGRPWLRVTFELAGRTFRLTLDPRQSWQAAGGKGTMRLLEVLHRWAGRSWSPRDARYAAHGTPAEASIAAARDAAAYLGGTCKVLERVE